jgi:hypothetical protein
VARRGERDEELTAMEKTYLERAGAAAEGSRRIEGLSVAALAHGLGYQVQIDVSIRSPSPVDMFPLISFLPSNLFST